MPTPSAPRTRNLQCASVLVWTPDMRRLLILASLVVFVDTMFFAAIVPLLPGLSDEFGLSKTEAGMLSGSYAAGTLLAAIPAGFWPRAVGPRPTTLVGLGVMTVTVLVFAFAESAPLLISSRFLQGVAGACSWAGALSWLVAASPRERRGELIGSAMAAAIVGVLVGPAVGALADVAEPRGCLLGGRRAGHRPRSVRRSGSRRPQRRAKRTSQALGRGRALDTGALRLPPHPRAGDDLRLDRRARPARNGRAWEPAPLPSLRSSSRPPRSRRWSPRSPGASPIAAVASSPAPSGSSQRSRPCSSSRCPRPPGRWARS